jgi:putative FmdB family regulatory protein
MPTYTYECKKCGEQQDVFHSMSATPIVACASCGSKRVKRLLGTGSGLIFKGSGFYETDYKNKGAKNGGSEGSKGSEKSGSESKPADASSSESKPPDSKATDTKKETKKSDTSGAKGKAS